MVHIPSDPGERPGNSVAQHRMAGRLHAATITVLLCTRCGREGWRRQAAKPGSAHLSQVAAIGSVKELHPVVVIVHLPAGRVGSSEVSRQACTDWHSCFCLLPLPQLSTPQGPPPHHIHHLLHNGAIDQNVAPHSDAPWANELRARSWAWTVSFCYLVGCAKAAKHTQRAGRRACRGSKHVGRSPVHCRCPLP